MKRSKQLNFNISTTILFFPFLLASINFLPYHKHIYNPDNPCRAYSRNFERTYMLKPPNMFSALLLPIACMCMRRLLVLHILTD